VLFLIFVRITLMIQIFSHSKLKNAFYNHSRSLCIQCSIIHSSLKLFRGLVSHISGDGFEVIFKVFLFLFYLLMNVSLFC